MFDFLHLYKRLKSFGFISIIPLVLLYIIFPFCSISLLKIGYDKIDALYIPSMYLIPIGSVWWIIIFFKSYIEDAGREIYYCYNKKKAGDVFILSLVYSFCSCSIFFLSFWMIKEISVILLCVQMILLIFMYGAITFFLIFLTHSTLAPYVIMLVYTLYVVAPDYSLSIKYLSYNTISLDYFNISFIIELLPYISVTVIAYILGIILNEAFNDYY